MRNKTFAVLGLGAMLLTSGMARAQDAQGNVDVDVHTGSGATMTGQAGMSTSGSTSGVYMRSGMSSSMHSSQIISTRRVYRTVRTYRMVPVYRSGRVISHRRVYYSRRMYRTVPVYRSAGSGASTYSRTRTFANTGE